MKVNQAKNHVIDFLGFTVQIGMIFGYTANDTPFATNGNIYNGYVNAYFFAGQNALGEYIWKKEKINAYEDEKLFFTIVKKSNKRGDMKFMTSAEIEAERWGKKEYENTPKSIDKLTKNEEEEKIIDANYGEYKTIIVPATRSGVFHDGHKSNHFGFRTQRIAK